MRSELKLHSPNLKVTVVIGLFATIIVITMAVLFKFEFGLILLSIAGTIAFVGCIAGTGKLIGFINDWQLQRLAVEQKKQELRITTYEADKAKLQAYVVSFPKNHRVVKLSDSPIQVIDAIAEPSPMMLSETITQEVMPNLLDVIQNESCVAFWGGRDSGKTTCALHWLSTRQGQNFVCDPKPKNHNPWPNAIVTNKIDDIERVVSSVYDELLNRQENELLNEPIINLFLDELYILTFVHKLDIMTHAFGIITLGREYRVNAGFTTSSKGVKSLGIEGMSGLSEALTFVHTSIVGGNHRVMVDMGEGENEVLSPGPYHPPTILPQWPDLQPPIIALTEAEMIEQAILNGDGNNQICKDIWGSKNTDRIARINAIREGVKVV